MNLKIKTLMNVLVIGGSTLVSHQAFAEELITQPQPVMKSLAFCSAKDPRTCEAKVVDNQCTIAPKDGLECCWGTSCDE